MKHFQIVLNDLSSSLCKNNTLVTTNGCFLKTKPQKFDAAMVYYKLKKNSKTLKRILRIKTLGKHLGKKTNILGQ